MDETPKKRVLVADDDEVWSRVLSLKLEKAGFSVHAVHDGLQALDALKKGGFDLVVLDLIMPKATGFDVLAQLRARGDKTPVFVNSSLSQDEDRKRVLDLGATGFFVKQEAGINSLVADVKKMFDV
ncbi:MAG: hypothetical protein RL272_270 [Candidatus Parcubacteria bacterium]|jgi:DNA-binding response OmpR family regulator